MMHQKYITNRKNSLSYLSSPLGYPPIKSHFLTIKDYVAGHFNSLHKTFLYLFPSSFPEVFCCPVTTHL